MDYYVNIKSGATRQGSGPLTKVTEWSVTRRMDGAGEWSFRVAATDAQIAQLVLKRTCEIYAYINTAYTYVGGGAIDRIERQIELDGCEFLRVTGDDQLRELANRTTKQTLLAQDDVLAGWSFLTNLGGRTAVCALFAVPSTSIVLAGTASTAGEHIYRSIDNGLTWELVFTGNTTSGYMIRCFSYTESPGVLLAGGDGGLYRTTDDGATWTTITTTATYSLCSAFGGFVQIRGGGGGNTFRSSDRGATWSAAIATGVGAVPIYDLIENASTGDILAAAGGRYIARSTDVGVTWVSPVVQFPAGSGASALCILYLTGSMLAGTDTGYVVRSTDNGASWGAGVRISTSPVYRLASYASNVIAAAGGKIYISDDSGVTFTELGDLGNATQTYALVALSASALAGADDNAALWRGASSVIGLTHAAAVAALEVLAPAGWDLVPDGTPTIDDIYIQFAGESVLTGALLVAERSGAHCYLSDTQELTFTDTWTDSGMHAVNEPTAIDANTAAIASLTVEASTYDLVSRVYPYGKMADGATLIGITNSALSAGTGYTKNNANGYIENDSAIASYGIIERMVTFNEIVLTEDTANGRVAVGDALVRAGKTYLERVCRSLTNYRLQLAGCAALLWPLQTIRITYTGDVVLDDTLYILDVTWRGDGNGLLTAEITVADAPVRIEADADVIARALRRVDGLAAR